jgi:hypothetical protein
MEVHDATSRQISVGNSGARHNRDSIIWMRTILGARCGRTDNSHIDNSHIDDNAVNGRAHSVRDAANHDI